MSLLAVGLSHSTAPVELLERVAPGREGVDKLLDDLATGEHVSEAVVIATCNRLEIYADVATFHGGFEEISALIEQHTWTARDTLTPHLYVHYEDRAVTHLFRVASGLDSMVVGETSFTLTPPRVTMASSNPRTPAIWRIISFMSISI